MYSFRTAGCLAIHRVNTRMSHNIQGLAPSQHGRALTQGKLEQEATRGKGQVTFRTNMGVNEMAQWVEVFPVKPGNLSLISRTYMVEQENQLPQVKL